MNTSENKKIQMNTQGSERLNNYWAEFRMAHKKTTDIIISGNNPGFIIPEKFLTAKEVDALTRLNQLANKSLRFLVEVREYTQMIAYINLFYGMSDENNSVNIDCDIIKPKKLEDEIIDKYGIDLYRDITSTNNKDKLGALSIDGYCTDILDLEYLARLLNNFDIKCSIDYDNDRFHYNIETRKEKNNNPII